MAISRLMSQAKRKDKQVKTTTLELKNEQWEFIIRALRDVRDFGNEEFSSIADKLADELEELTEGN
jgi:phosphopantetheine adenylyltransferase